MNLTQKLKLARNGDTQARADLLEAAYDDLRQLASGRMSGERQNHTLTSTALVNEVSMKLLSDTGVPTESRSQFFAYVARAMRNLLIDHARTKGRQKRGGGHEKLKLQEAIVASDQQCVQFLELNDALETLAELEPRKAQVVEMRYFAGMSNQEIASALDISLATVKRDWNVAKTWMLRELSRDS